jgi:hypothetical protein
MSADCQPTASLGTTFGYRKPWPVGREGAVHACLAHEVRLLVFINQQYEEASHWQVLQVCHHLNFC